VVALLNINKFSLNKFQIYYAVSNNLKVVSLQETKFHIGLRSKVMRKKNNETICNLVPISQKILYLFIYLFFKQNLHLSLVSSFFFFKMGTVCVDGSPPWKKVEGMVNSFLS